MSTRRSGAVFTVVLLGSMTLAACGGGATSRPISTGGGSPRRAGLVTSSGKASVPTAATLRQRAELRRKLLDSAVDSASASVNDDEAGLQRDVTTLQTDDATLAGDLLTANNDISTQIGALQQVGTDVRSNNGDACADAAIVGSMSSSAVGGDQYNLELATGGAPSLGQGVISEEAQLGSSDEKAATADLATLVSDWATLAHAVAADPGYPPFGGTPYRGFDVTAMLQTRQAIASFEAQVQKIEREGKVLVESGLELVAKAQQLC